MTTKNPRLTLTLTPTIAGQLKRISQLTGNSQASLVSELLEAQEFVFSRVIQTLEAAQFVRNDMKTSFSRDLAKSQQAIEKELGIALEQLDDASLPIIEQAEKIKRRRGREGSGAARYAQACQDDAGPSRPASEPAQDPHLLTGGSKC